MRAIFSPAAAATGIGNRVEPVSIETRPRLSSRPARRFGSGSCRKLVDMPVAVHPKDAERRLDAQRVWIGLFRTLGVNLGAVRTDQERPGDDARGGTGRRRCDMRTPFHPL